jgi:hypothetical protein
MFALPKSMVKRQAREWKKIFVNQIYYKGFISTIKKILIKTNNPIRK